MDFSGAVQWWDEWHLRVLVLGSLFVQFMLFFSAMLRRCALPPLLRLLIWLAYLGGDALPIYALATLFNRHKQGQQHDGTGLEVLWAPVLLIHLWGQHMMAAYSIEDNELWRRHAITVVSQVAVALYVFCKSWSGEKGLLQVAILLFVVGIIRSIQKPWGMRNASVNSIVASFSLSTRREEGFFELCCREMCGCSFVLYQSRDKIREEEKDEEKDMTLEEFVQEVSKNLPELASDQEQAAEHLALHPENVFSLLVDMSSPYSRRIKSLKLSMALDYRHANTLTTNILRQAFYFLYTKIPAIFELPGFCFYFCLPALTLVSLILFSTNRKNHNFNTVDVRVTYILLSCTVVLDFLFFLLGPAIVLMGQEKVSQHNLLSFCARKKQPTVMMKLATLVCCKDYVNMHCYTEYVPTSSSLQVTELVHGYIRDGWKGYIHDAASYRRFNSRKGQWALRHLRHVEWSVKMSFDRSVLLWHIATELCFHHQRTTTRGQQCAAQSRVISHYMTYLLCIHPEMLMPGTRNNIFIVACDDVDLILGLSGELPLDAKGLAHGILARGGQPLVGGTNMIGALLPNACKLAKALMEMRDEGQRWEVVQGVWVELLCYSAGRCRGYLHAKNMSEVPELLSRIWFLLSSMGMETFADRFQKSEHPETNEEEDEEKGNDDGQGRCVESKINIPI